MTHSNRGRLTVDPAGDWKIYAGRLNSGWTPLGTVTRGDDTGALVKIDGTGAYAQVNAGVMRTLDARKVRAALGETDGPGAGRPAILDGGKRINVYLDAESLERASKLGDGNISDGIRQALKAAVAV